MKVRTTQPKDGNPHNTIKRQLIREGFSPTAGAFRITGPAPRKEPPRAKAPMPAKPLNRGPQFLWKW
jgi:hypothetical protein